MKNDESLFGSRTHESIYHQIGGEPVLNAAVDLFYEKVLADKRIKQFFDGTDMSRLRETQKQFLMYALGGPIMYSGKEIRKAHRHLDLTEEHFEAVQQHFEDTLRELKIKNELIEAVLGITASHHDDVLNL